MATWKITYTQTIMEASGLGMLSPNKKIYMHLIKLKVTNDVKLSHSECLLAKAKVSPFPTIPHLSGVLNAKHEMGNKRGYFKIIEHLLLVM